MMYGSCGIESADKASKTYYNKYRASDNPILTTDTDM